MKIKMKKSVKNLLCLAAAISMATSVCAAEVELFALNGDTIKVDESEVEAYTAPGMGWYSEKPVTMYSLEGNTTVVPADKVEANMAVGWYLEKPITMYSADGRTLLVAPDQVEAYKNVGWFLEDELPGEEKVTDTDKPVIEEVTTPADTNKTVRVKYTDNTVVSVPEEHLKFYLALDWVQVTEEEGQSPAATVTMYDAAGNSKEVPADKVSEYELSGWSTTKPKLDYITVYNHKNETKEVVKDTYESFKAQGWYAAYEEAVYAYAAFGDGGENLGAVKLLENKKYEAAFNAVAEAITKIENSDSVYVQMLYDLRTGITDTWREAANSPLGFINYFFTERDGQRVVMFDYRNVSNSRIKYIGINFDICDKDGTVIETNEDDYYADNMQLAPCEKTRVGWKVETGNDAVSVKNVKVKEVKFADGTVWTAAK